MGVKSHLSVALICIPFITEEAEQLAKLILKQRLRRSQPGEDLREERLRGRGARRAGAEALCQAGAEV